MKYINLNPSVQGAEDSEDTLVASEILETKLADIEQKLAQLPANSSMERANLLLDSAYTRLELEKDVEAWQLGHEVFKIFADAEDWEAAVQAADIIYNANQSDALVALGNGVWLAVTFPIDPELTAVMLDHIVEETPADSDGAAVAAVTAHYIADLRSENENLLFFTNQLLAKVARRHSNVEKQADFEAWMKKMELDSPPDFLGRLSQVLNVMVQDDWWVNRDALREKIEQ
ncbi:hypothetical protein [Candidatus Marithrix sp. Canyon 246]|uniref:hypothetical protein n=1 Tax=Candidatus Marithrix sp. Canyon 246 TaxID=1827136 RepID=UPI00084A1308|nr:hypothetical protein [Candidatus Marithrix sp. Canyon 246]